jgi:poly(3-hydroxybutyrate) depolymerase
LAASGSTGLAAPPPAATAIELKTVSGHPMQYYVVRPQGWSPDRQWPIVVVVEAAEKQFKQTAESFAKAGEKLPFVIVTPITVTNGNAGHRDPAVYPYSTETWDRIDRDTCAFDEEGLSLVVKDVRAAYRGEDLVYLTGFEAGGHLVWATVFHHPETLAAAAPVAGNYRGRCVDGKPFSPAASRSALPVRGLTGDRDLDFGPQAALFSQWKDARKVAEDHGYLNVREMIVAGKAHVPLPDEVLAYFDSLRKAPKR